MAHHSENTLKFPRTRRNFRSGFGSRLEAWAPRPPTPRTERVDGRIPAVGIRRLDHDVVTDGEDTAYRQQMQQAPYLVHANYASSTGLYGRDHVDGPPIDPHMAPYGCIDLLFNIISIFSFLFDMGSDIYLCLTYYREREFVYFALTLAFVAIPSLIMTCFSLRWYVKDYGDNQIYNGHYEISCCRWTIRILGLVFQMGPILRYVDAMYYGVKSWKTQGKAQEYYYTQMMFEDADSCLLRLMECTMEAGPQLALQLYIMSTQGDDQTHLKLLIQAVSCVTSLISIAWCVTSYTRALRFTRDDKENMSNVSMAVHFLWQTFMAIPRVLALAMFAAAFTYWVFVLIGTHWIVMTAWLIIQKTNFTEANRCEETLFNVVIGAVYVLCYLNVKEGRTRHKYTFYYLITYLENSGMILSWYFVKQSPRDWYYLPTVVVVLVAFFAGLLCMQVYYFCCHPTGNIQVCYSDGSTSNVRSVAEPVLIDPLMEQHELDGSVSSNPL